MKSGMIPEGDSGLETAISYLLLAGIIISTLLELAGMVMYYQQYGNLTISRVPDVFINGSNFFSFIYEQLRASGSGGTGLRLMMLGLIVLMLVPFIRVVLSVVYFVWEKNLRYVWITLFVLVAITLSLMFH
jgi:uncharacterized membrane protein